jgi:hypothetical protein
LAAVPLLALAIVYFLGRIPSDYAIEEECTRVQQQRRQRATLLRHEIARLEMDKRKGAAVDDDLKRLKGELDDHLRAPHHATLGAWDAVLLPSGAARPDPSDWFVWGEFDASEPTDGVELSGRFTIWLRPSGALAKLSVRVGLAP